ncbi:phage shock protein E (rhodanase-like protein) [Escherichia coli]|uniref:Phage shock protein E (Rhodanase-like protein) n=1 Tax=Escherichia coli TaxID=562 RepID=A0A376J7T2_ECOLX|nr:phage shock protein E (rhodanase-like protein) [Escherichia coli]
MFKKGLLALTLVFSLPVFAAEHWIDVRVPEQYQQEHVQGAINIPLKEVKERIATAVPDKNDTVKVYCNAGRQSGQAKEILSEMGYTHVENAGGPERHRNAEGQRLKESTLSGAYAPVYFFCHTLFTSP